MTQAKKDHTTQAVIRGMNPKVRDQALIEMAKRVAALEGNDPEDDAIYALERAQDVAERVLRKESSRHSPS